ncbi:hypothetical protein AB0G06_43730 [Nonomuraea dietziae]|uniref:hypothetical protein n=1 Tax=Nonomuraea dietziae TaxID=65515 RepID=UPI0033DE2F1A
MTDAPKRRADKPAKPKTEGVRAATVVVHDEVHHWKADPPAGFEHRAARARFSRKEP